MWGQSGKSAMGSFVLGLLSPVDGETTSLVD
jgi:hypothetical protein